MLSDYYGNEAQVTLQRRIRDRTPRIADTPALASGGRLMVVVEPDELGWNDVRTLAEKDGVLAIGPGSFARLAPAVSQAFPQGWNTPHYECWSADWPTVEASIEPIFEVPLPIGWSVEAAIQPDARTIADAQALAEASGVAPLPGYYHSGQEVDTVLATIRDDDERVVATAHGDMRYHPNGLMGGTCFAGLVAVDKNARGRGLGRRANAEVLKATHDAFGWTRVVEMAKATNIASSRMIRACGMVQYEDWCVFVIIPDGREFTR